jgi:hypothetical protein
MNNQTNQRRGEYLVDDSEERRYDINNCSLVFNSSAINGLSECQHAEQEEQTKRRLNGCCSIISSNGNMYYMKKKKLKLEIQ